MPRLSGLRFSPFACALLIAAGATGLLSARPTVAEAEQVTLYPSADNLLLYDYHVGSYANTVYRTNELAVGCNWLGGDPRSTVFCAATIIRFDVPSALVGALVTSAELRLRVRSYAADYETEYEISTVFSSWSPFTVTWNTAPLIVQELQTRFAPLIMPVLALDVTASVAAWVTEELANNGFLIEDTDFFEPLGITALRATSFYSSDVYLAASDLPQLTIEYTVPEAHRALLGIAAFGALGACSGFRRVGRCAS